MELYYLDEDNYYTRKYWCDICGKEILENVGHIACVTATKIYVDGDTFHFHNKPCFEEKFKPQLLTRCKNKYGDTILLLDSNQDVKADIKEYVIQKYKPSVDKEEILKCEISDQK